MGKKDTGGGRAEFAEKASGWVPKLRCRISFRKKEGESVGAHGV